MQRGEEDNKGEVTDNKRMKNVQIELTKEVRKARTDLLCVVTLTTENPKVLSSGRPTQTPAYFRAEAVERPAASVATAAAAAAAPALECV